VSATNRGAVRNEHDFYPTPAWCVHRLLEAVPLPAGRWLEPCVGDGAIVRAVNACRGVEWFTNDIRSEVAADVHGDFLAPAFPHARAWEVLLTNPPFSLALDFAAKGIDVAGVVVLLLRLNWLRGTDEHNAWLRAHMPSVYVLPQRPSFDGRGTDATEYAWMVWGLDQAPTIAMLDDTPDEVRASHNLEMRRREKAIGDLFAEKKIGGLFG